MKRIVCIFLTALMLLTMLSVSVSAEEQAKKSYKVNWSELDYTAYGYDVIKTDFETYYRVTATDSLLSFASISSTKLRSYVVNERLKINNNTKYEYVFQVKNNYHHGFCGAVFAFANGLPYFVYGGFNNSSDSGHSGQCKIDIKKGLHSHDTRDCNTGFNATYITLATDSDEYVTLKVVYDGFKATLYGIADSASGAYVKIGNTITLPSDAEVAVGAYNRSNDSSTNLERTVSIKNATLYAMNDEAVKHFTPFTDAGEALIEYVEQIEAQYPRDDYEKESYSELVIALNDAKLLIEGGSITANQAESARNAIDDAILLLIPIAPDFTELDDIVAKAEELSADDYDEEAYASLMESVEEAYALSEAFDATQSQIDALTAVIRKKYAQLVGEDIGDGEENEDNGENGDSVTEPDNSDNAAGDDSSDSTTTESGSASEQATEKGGCRSVVVGSSLLSICALAGVSALVLKKKED